MCYGIGKENPKGELAHSQAHKVNFDFFNILIPTTLKVGWMKFSTTTAGI